MASEEGSKRRRKVDGRKQGGVPPGKGKTSKKTRGKGRKKGAAHGARGGGQGAGRGRGGRRQDEEWTAEQEQQFEAAYKRGVERDGLTWRSDGALLKLFFGHLKRGVKGKSAYQCFRYFQQARIEAKSVMSEAAVDSSAASPSNSSVSSAVPVPVPVPMPISNDDWSENEQRLLDAALAECKHIEITQDRWRAIAALVPSRSLKECVAQYKRVRLALRK